MKHASCIILVFLICIYAISGEICEYQYKVINSLYSDEGTYYINAIVCDSKIICYIDIYNTRNTITPKTKAKPKDTYFILEKNINKDFIFIEGQNTTDSLFFIDYYDRTRSFGFYIWQIKSDDIINIKDLIIKKCFTKWLNSILVNDFNCDSLSYLQEFRYDTQNRLTRADMLSDYFGEYTNYNLTYSPSGMLGIKSCDDLQWNYWYGFCNKNKHIANHQVRSIYDLENDETTFLQYTSDGNLQDIIKPCTGDFRHHSWNQAGLVIVSPHIVLP